MKSKIKINKIENSNDIFRGHTYAVVNNKEYTYNDVISTNTFSELEFIEHCVNILKPNSVAYIACSQGILYRDSDEKNFRKHIIDNNYVDVVMQLPPLSLCGSVIPSTAIYFNKSKTRKTTAFVDLSDDLFEKSDHKSLFFRIFDEEFADRVRLVDNDEIAAQNYNLCVSNYLERENLRNLDKYPKQLEDAFWKHYLLTDYVKNKYFGQS